MEITRLKVCETTLNIEYQVYNNTSTAIWVCEDVSIHLPANEITEIEETAVYVQRKVSGYPEMVVFEEPMIGKYVYLESGSTKKYVANIILFEQFMAFSTKAVSSSEPQSFSDVSSVHLSVGYLDAELCRTYLKLASTDPEKETGISRELPQFVKEYHADTDNPKTLYIPHFWKGIKDENSLSTSCLLHNQATDVFPEN